MTEQTFIINEIERGFRAGYSIPNGNLANHDWNALKTNLIKPKWKPNDEQVYWCANGIDNGYQQYDSGKVFHIGINDRPLTTKKAGPECMQHLVDALVEIANTWGNERMNADQMREQSKTTLIKHKELMK